MSNGIIKTISEIGLERLDKCSKQMGQRFFGAVRPCFALDDASLPVALGSCFLMRLDGVPFLVTAAHVVDQSARTTLFVGSSDRPIPLEGIFSVTSKPNGLRNDDPFDFAFAELSPEQCEALRADFFITEDMVSQNRANKENRGYMALGYPVMMQLFNYGISKAFTEAWTFVGFHRPSSGLYEALGVTGTHHFAIRFEDRVKTFAGREKDAPDPEGASGGILIDLGNFDPAKLAPDAACVGLLSSILIEHRREHRAIVATDIQVVIEQMRHYLMLPADRRRQNQNPVPTVNDPPGQEG